MTDNRFDSFSRRAVLRTSLAGAVGMMTGFGLKGAFAQTADIQHKRGGKLRIAAMIGSNADMDPHGTTSDAGVKGALYDALVDEGENIRLFNSLAEEFGPVNGDLKLWRVKLRAGIKWHDGKPLTADDVAFTIRRITNPQNPRAAAALMSGIITDKMEKVDDLTLLLPLKEPNSQLQRAFTPSYSRIVPVDFDPKNPVGTGPFKFKSFVPEQHWVGERFDGYWGMEGGAYIDQLEFLSFASSAAALNALLAGQVDGIPNIQAAQVPLVANRPNLKVIESETGYIIQVGMNSRKGAKFEDPRVREAFKLILDRQQLVNSVYFGHGAIGNDIGVFPQWEDGVDPNLPVPTRDLDRAKALLKEAGQENMTVKLRVTQQIPGMIESAQVIQQQCAEAGVTVNIDVVADPAQFYTDDYFTAEMQIDYTNTLSMYAACYYYWLKKADYNSTGYDNPAVDKLFDEGVGSPQEVYVEKMRELSRIIQKEGPWIVWGRQNILDVHSDKVLGFNVSPGNGFLNGLNFSKVSFA